MCCVSAWPLARLVSTAVEVAVTGGSVTVCLSVCLFWYLMVCVFVCLFVAASASPLGRPAVCASVKPHCFVTGWFAHSQSISQSVGLSVCLAFSVCMCVCVCVSLSPDHYSCILSLSPLPLCLSVSPISLEHCHSLSLCLFLSSYCYLVSLCHPPALCLSLRALHFTCIRASPLARPVRDSVKHTVMDVSLLSVCLTAGRPSSISVCLGFIAVSL